MRASDVFKRTYRPVPVTTAEAIQRMIRGGGLVSGDRLPSQRDLARDLNVSRPSLREALSMLETLGVIRIEAGRGVFVAEPADRRRAARPPWRFGKKAALSDVFEVRIAIEGLATRLAVQRMSDREIALLGEASDALQAAADARDVVAAAEHDARFHDLVFSACGNPVLQAVYAQIRALLVESQRVPMIRRESVADTAREHRRVADRCRRRDGPGAGKAMEAHIRAAAARAGIALA